ncbi:hypothetical protein [Thalassospira xiamenensis]|uniref:hypothetical protein n=1 Tax=Thalassospira xiamenensis TaxID=220697 RepID=UPI000DEDD345|nr:hypothetical protein [Thalassospira xiamenensis]RCK40457.1 hypothetical protein TH24_10990 [Thalassospira xiamenensis]
MTHHTITPSPWPNTGEPNKWFMHAARFMNEIANAPGFWCLDHNFKYLTIRVDTRERNDFKLYIDGNDGEKIEISADDVIAAIFNWTERYPDAVTTPECVASQRDILLSHASSALNMCEEIKQGYPDPDISHVEFRNTVMEWADNFIKTAKPTIDAATASKREGQAA